MTRKRQMKPKVKVADLNVLPERHRRQGINPLVVLAFLLWAVLLGLLYPGGKYFLRAQNEFSQRQAELIQIQEEIETYQTVEERLENLRTEIDGTEVQIQEIRERYSELNLETVSWSRLLFSLTDEIPQGVILDQISQTETRVEISGSATSYQLVLDLEDNLKTIPGFASVEIDSIQFLRPAEDAAENEQPAEDFDQDQPYLFGVILDTSWEEVQP